MGSKGTLRAMLIGMLLCIFVLVNVPASGENVQVRSAALSSQTKTMNGMVRVYLSSLGNPSVLNLTIRGNYSVNGEFLYNGANVTVGFDSYTGSLTLSWNGQTRSMGRQFSIRRHSASGTNGILIAQGREPQNPYPGDLSFEAVSTTTGYKLYTIAHIYIEDYLYGVLPYEMGNSSNIEALKAQAVAARTYTVRMMSRRASGTYDVVDTTSDQVYRGTPSGNANCVSAVDATKGIVLMYGSEYITTYYSASNGGQTETARGGTSYPYLQVKDDPFDYANTSSTVKSQTIYADLGHSANPSQLMSLLRTKAAAKLNQMGYAATAVNTSLLTLRSVTPHTPMYASPSRLYTKMDFAMTVSTGSAYGLNVTVTCDIFDELESMLSMGIQSSDNELWSVVSSSGSFTLQARRYGHGMGMSQRGAMHMAKLGYRYDEILGFYFDGCTRVSHSFIHTILSSSSADVESTVQPPAYVEDGASYACRGTVQLASAAAMLGVRASCSSSAALVGVAANGSVAEVLMRDGSWYLIRFGEICGYVPASALSISGTPPQTYAPVSSILGFSSVTANDYLNLRASASTNARVLGTAPAGAVLTVFSREGSWAKVQYNALVAYVSTQYLSSISASVPNIQVSSGSSTATIRTEDMSSSVNLRQSPSMNALVLAQMPHGSSVTVHSDDGSWSRVSYQGYTGYVVSSFLAYDGVYAPDEPEQPESTPPASTTIAVVATEYGALNMRSEARAGSMIVTTIPKGAEVQVISCGDGWTAVYYNGFNGYVVSSYLAFREEQLTPEQPPVSSVATVVTPSGSLNLRSEPRSGSQILTTIPPYEQVVVEHYGSQWCQVTWRGVNGYVMTSFLSFESAAPSEPEQPAVPDGNEHATVMTDSGSLNLRMEPTSLSQVIAQIPRGDTVRIHQHGANWCYVSYGSQSGYVMTRFLSFVSTVPPSYEEPEQHAGIAYVNTSFGALNLREYPGSQYAVLTGIPQNAQVDVIQYGDEWSQVRYGSYVGYVMTSYLRWDRPEPDDGWDKPAEPTGTDGWVATASGTLNLREGPSSTTRVLAVMPRASKILWIDKGTEWSYIRYQDQYGYAMTRYLSAEYPSSPYAAPEAFVTNNGVKMDVTLTRPERMMYAVNATGYAIELWPMCEENGVPVATLDPWDEVEIILIGEVWSCVDYNGIQGYCQTRLLDVVQ